MKLQVTALAVGVLALSTLPVVANAATATVTVHPGTTLATVGTGLGINDIGFDPNMHAAGTTAALRADNIQLRALDSGAWTDVYRWQSNTFDSDPITDGVGVK